MTTRHASLPTGRSEILEMTVTTVFDAMNASCYPLVRARERRYFPSESARSLRRTTAPHGDPAPPPAARRGGGRTAPIASNGRFAPVPDGGEPGGAQLPGRVAHLRLAPRGAARRRGAQGRRRLRARRAGADRR